MRKTLFSLLIILSAHASAEWADSYPPGSAFPEVSAQDQTHKNWTRKELIGRNGLIFFVNRSTTW